MGGVKDTYLKKEDARAQYVGRCARYMYQMDKFFAVSPPYFDFSHLDEVEALYM